MKTLALCGLRAQVEVERNEPLTVEEVAQAYLEICDNDCAGDRSVGIPNCEFYEEPDMDLDGHVCTGGCRLKRYLHKPPEPVTP